MSEAPQRDEAEQALIRDHAYIGRLAELERVLPRLPALLRGRADDLPAALGHADVSEARGRLETSETG